MRTARTMLAIGLVAAVAWLLLEILGSGAMPSYFAAWLFWVGFPMGALPLVMAMEAAGVERAPLLPILRRMLPLLPLSVLFAIPVLIASSGLFARTTMPGALPAWWTAPEFLVPRDVVLLAILSILALVFRRVPHAPRRRLAVFGLLLHLVVCSVAAVDWVVAPQPGYASSAAGLLLIASQMAEAAALAGFALAVGSRSHVRLPASVGIALALLLALWGFMHFIQFLVAWSANLPNEAAWYLARSAGFGTFTIAFAACVAMIGCTLLPSAAGRIPTLLASVTAPALVVLMLSSFWLVTPGYRGHFSITFGDLFSVVGIGGLSLGLLLIARADRPAEPA